MHHGYTADSSRGTYAFMLAELLSVSAVVGLSVAAVLCPWCQWLCRAVLLLSADVVLESADMGLWYLSMVL